MFAKDYFLSHLQTLVLCILIEINESCFIYAVPICYKQSQKNIKVMRFLKIILMLILYFCPQWVITYLSRVNAIPSGNHSTNLN